MPTKSLPSNVRKAGALDHLPTGTKIAIQGEGAKSTRYAKLPSGHWREVALVQSAGKVLDGAELEAVIEELTGGGFAQVLR
jgi:hypothetical protein